MNFSYQAEKFACARRALMLPHTNGIAASIEYAFMECSHGMHNLSKDSLDDSARNWINVIERFMDTSEIQDPTGRGAWLIKAEQLSVDDQMELSRLIDELAFWFERFDG